MQNSVSLVAANFSNANDACKMITEFFGKTNTLSSSLKEYTLYLKSTGGTSYQLNLKVTKINYKINKIHHTFPEKKLHKSAVEEYFREKLRSYVSLDWYKNYGFLKITQYVSLKNVICKNFQISMEEKSHALSNDFP